MKYYPLLYSRSFEKDYRWMLIGPDMDLEFYSKLKIINDHFDQIKEKINIDENNIPPLYFLVFQKYSVLLQNIKSNHTDKFGRAIYALQGIYVPNEYLRDFWYLIPWIIDSKKFINIWDNINFETADELSMNTESIIELDLEIKFNNKFLNNLLLQPFRKIDEFPIYLPYSNIGYSVLLEFLLSPMIPITEFCYGISKECFNEINNINIVALLGENKSNLIKNSIKENKNIKEIKVCEIKIKSKKNKHLFGIRSNETLFLVAEISINNKKLNIIKENLGYPSDHYNLIKKAPTLKTKKILENILQQLKNEGWKIVSHDKEKWWGYKLEK